jgi:ABC-2 type transport system ATP-binding protein
MTSALVIQNLVASYDGKRNVLDDVSIDVRRGEAFGLIGLNGEGKTTMIKTILGLRRAVSGKIAIMGHPNTDQMARVDVSYLPERFDPPWFLVGDEFIRFSAKLYGRTVADPDIVDMAQCLGLDPAALPRSVNTYSKGMRQKLGLIATVATGCNVLILDEPMSGLDPRARVQVKDLILRERAKGKTIFLSSHILSDLDEMCDRVAILHQGKIRYDGPPVGARDQTGAQTLEKAFLTIIQAA